jgi:hypothetical protein
MSSDDPEKAGLRPDYQVPWEELFKDLVKFVLGNNASVQTWGNEEKALIKSKGFVLGQVSRVRSDRVHSMMSSGRSGTSSLIEGSVMRFLIWCSGRKYCLVGFSKTPMA